MAVGRVFYTLCIASLRALHVAVLMLMGLLLQVPLTQKLFWTVVSLLVYLVCTQMPLYGINAAKNSDPFYIMRMILASSRFVAP